MRSHLVTQLGHDVGNDDSRSVARGCLVQGGVIPSRRQHTHVAVREINHLTEGHRYACFEHFSGELAEVKDTTRLDVKLGGCGVKLYIFAPIHEGFAPIGLANKYIAPKAVLQTLETARGLRVILREGGEFVASLAKRPAAVHVDGKPLKAGNWTYQGNALRAHIPDKRSSNEPVRVDVIQGRGPAKR